MAMFDKEFQDLFDTLEKIKPTDIMKAVGITPQKVKWCGENHYKCLCPFPGHRDETTGSFDVNDEKLVAKCFSCGRGGRPIRFFRDLCGMENDFEAGIELAVLFGYMSREKASRILKKSDLEIAVSHQTCETKKKTSFRKEEPKMQPLEVRMEFYEAFTRNLPLNEKDRAYLLGRGVQENELDQFFSYPITHNKLHPFFLKTQEELGWELEKYIGIPGLFLCQPSDKAPYIRAFTPTGECVGMKIYNVDHRNLKY